MLLTGVEGDVLWVEVSLAFNSEHLDWVASACRQVGKLKGQTIREIRERLLVDLHAVVVDVTGPPLPWETGARSRHASHVCLAEETICGWK